MIENVVFDNLKHSFDLDQCIQDHRLPSVSFYNLSLRVAMHIDFYLPFMYSFAYMYKIRFFFHIEFFYCLI